MASGRWRTAEAAAVKGGVDVGVAVADTCTPGPSFFVEVGAFGRVRAAAGLGVAHVDVETLTVGENEDVDLVAQLVGEG